MENLELENLHCDGCGVPLQYNQADQLGFIPRLKVSQYFKKKQELQEYSDHPDAKLRKLLQGEQLSDKGHQQDLIQHLRSANMPQEVIAEFEHAQQRPGGQRSDDPGQRRN